MVWAAGKGVGPDKASETVAKVCESAYASTAINGDFSVYSLPADGPEQQGALYHLKKSQDWHIGGKGQVYRMAHKTVSVSDEHTIEELWTGLAIAPSDAWLQILEKTNRIPPPSILQMGMGLSHLNLPRFSGHGFKQIMSKTKGGFYGQNRESTVHF